MIWLPDYVRNGEDVYSRAEMRLELRRIKRSLHRHYPLGWQDAALPKFFAEYLHRIRYDVRRYCIAVVVWAFVSCPRRG